jgi:predicted acyltransferase
MGIAPLEVAGEATVAEEATAVAPSASRAPSAPPAARLLSLDVFRGVTIAGMLLVNNPGSWSHQYSQLKHAEWHGWTATDLIFPFFLFIVGVSMTFSYARMREKGATRADLLVKSVKRAGLIFLVGLVLHGFPNYIERLPNFRIPGVLQRIALAYLVATPVVLFLRVKGIVATIAALLFGYWFLQTMVPVPGVGPSILAPGLDLGAYIDRAVFTTNHLYSAAKTWDPEGLLSTLPAVGTLLLGVLAGYWIRSERSGDLKTVGLFVAGHVGLLVGLAWHQVFPINKPLWTSSYVVFTAGMACHFLAMCYWLIDVRGYQRWTKPFVIFGVNALAAFFLSGIMARLLGIIKIDGRALKTVIYSNAFESWLSPINASLAFAIAFVLVWLGIMSIFYRKRIFIKL